MSTNYYRIPSVSEIENKHKEFMKKFSELDLSPYYLFDGLKTIEEGYDRKTIWDEFLENTSVHIGKRSGGWKFLWNFNEEKYYSNKEELLNFIKSGRVVDEYGTEIDSEEFITMALEWGQPDGLDAKSYRKKHPKQYHYDFDDKEEIYIDGLRVSPYTEFF